MADTVEIVGVQALVGDLGRLAGPGGPLDQASSAAALKLLAEGAKIDLVFSDIVMPGTIDGVGLASEIRSQYPNLPVILTTGYSDAARAAPAHLRILRKPFDTDALRGFVQDAMGVRLGSDQSTRH